jgi:uncharacterized protein YjbI with pentapeptide repeats
MLTYQIPNLVLKAFFSPVEREFISDEIIHDELNAGYDRSRPIGSDMRSCTFDNTNIIHANFSNVNLRGSTFKNCCMDRVGLGFVSAKEVKYAYPVNADTHYI